MKNLKITSAIVLFAIGSVFTSCTQDEHMDEILSNTEINSPSNSSDTIPVGDDEENRPTGD